MAKKKHPYPTVATTYNIPVTTYLLPSQVKKLTALAQATGKPKTILLREAVDDLLNKYKGGKR